MDFSALNAAVEDVFGEPVILRRAGVPDVSVSGIYDSRHYANEDGEMGSSDLVTTVTVRFADLPTVAVDQTLIARSTVYRIADLRPDGQGMLVLVLDRAA